jgi:hypothetical protein
VRKLNFVFVFAPLKQILLSLVLSEVCKFNFFVRLKATKNVKSET